MFVCRPTASVDLLAPGDAGVGLGLDDDDDDDDGDNAPLAVADLSGTRSRISSLGPFGSLAPSR